MDNLTIFALILDYFSDVQAFFDTQKLPMGIRVFTLGSKQVEKTSQ